MLELQNIDQNIPEPKKEIENKNIKRKKLAKVTNKIINKPKINQEPIHENIEAKQDLKDLKEKQNLLTDRLLQPNIEPVDCPEPIPNENIVGKNNFRSLKTQLMHVNIAHYIKEDVKRQDEAIKIFQNEYWYKQQYAADIMGMSKIMEKITYMNYIPRFTYISKSN